MNIIIVGCGKVGFSLAEQLVREKHNITVMDPDEETLQRASDAMDIMTVSGSGSSAVDLRQAGADEADLMVAATSSDEVNMVCCLLSKNLGTRYTIARIRNPEYISSLADLRRNLNIDMVINPENSTAIEISRLLRFPAAANIETFCRGRVELIGFRLQEDDFLTDKPLRELDPRVKSLPLLFCAADRDGEVYIPNGNFIPRAGDQLYVAGQPAALDRFFILLGRYVSKAKKVFLVGGGKVSLYLAHILDKLGMQLKIVERDEARCRMISEKFPRAIVLCADGTDSELLESENLTSYDAFVALTDRDEDNLIISLYAMQRGISKVITKCTRQNYAGIVRSLGLDSIVSPKFITASHILHMVRGLQNSKGSVMNSLHRIADGHAEAMEFTVGPSTRHLGVPLRDLHLRSGILVAVIVRGKEIIIPEGSSCLMENDLVIIIARKSGLSDLNDIYEPEFSFPGTGNIE